MAVSAYVGGKLNGRPLSYLFYEKRLLDRFLESSCCEGGRG